MRFFFTIETVRKLKANEAEHAFNTDVLAPEYCEEMTICTLASGLCLSGGMVKLKNTLRAWPSRRTLMANKIA